MTALAADIRVSIVIPAYNEGESIATVVRQVRKVMEDTDYSFEILVVDDGSTDDTAKNAETQEIRVIPHEQNLGSGASRKTGIRASQGEWIWTDPKTNRTHRLHRIINGFDESRPSGTVVEYQNLLSKGKEEPKTYFLVPIDCS